MTHRSIPSLMRKWLLASAIFLIACVGHATADDWDVSALLITSAESVAHLESGRRNLFEGRIVAAEADFGSLSGYADGKAAALYHLSTVSLLKYLMRDREEDLDEFFDRSGRFKQELDAIPDSPWRAFLGAEANLQRAIAHAKSGRYVRAALASRTAYSEYSRVVADNPNFYDAYKGLGLLHLAIGSAPASFRGVLKFLGFSGSIPQGMEELQLAADYSVFSREEAQIYLALADLTILGSTSNNGAELKTLYERFPESPLFAHLYGFYLYENRELESARTVFDEAATLGSMPGVLYVDYVDYYLAQVHFRSDDFGTAEQFYRSYVDRHAGPALKASAMLGIGLSLEMQGRRAEALPYYSQVQVARSFDVDAVARRAAATLQTSRLDSVGRTLVLAANAYDSGRYELSIALAERAVADSASDTQAAEAYYRIGRSFQALGVSHLALESLDKVFTLPEVEAETRWTPWSRYYSGVILEAEGHIEAARHAYKLALEHPGPFDYHQGLEKNCLIALARLDRDGGR